MTQGLMGALLFQRSLFISSFVWVRADRQLHRVSVQPPHNVESQSLFSQSLRHVFVRIQVISTEIAKRIEDDHACGCRSDRIG
jgi:hypothetical protein